MLRTMANAFHRFPDQFKTQEMFIKAVEVDPSFFQLVLDHFQAKEMCDKAIKEDSSSLQFIPDCFVTREGLYMWHDDYYDDDGGHWDDDDEDKFFERYDGYKKCKGQKAKIKDELMPISCHPNHVMDWGMSRRREGVVEVTDSCF